MACLPLRNQVRATVSQNIYFANCSIGPQLETTGEAIASFVRVKEKLPMDYGEIFGKAVGPAREKLGAFLGASAENIAFCGSVAQAINYSAWCIPFEPGDNVILCDCEFASNVYPWVNMGKRRNVEVRIVPNDQGGLTIDRLNQYADSRTKAVTVSAVQFGNGFKADLKAIGAWCKEHGAYLVVDTAQSLGVIPMDVIENNISFMAGCGAKWMLSGFGTGFLYVKKDLITTTEPPFPASDSMDKDPDCIDYSPKYKMTAARFETGAQNLPGIVALGRTIDTFNEIGFKNICDASAETRNYFIEKLLSMDISLAPSQYKEETRSGIVSFDLPNVKEGCDFLNAHNVSCDVRLGRIRTGIHGYNTKDEVDTVCDLIKDYLKK